MRKRILPALMFFAIIINASADEGMWIPMFLDKYNIEDMQKKGFKLTAEDIYSINNTSLKDAVVIFGGGCTGELISDEGLLITNHHCGYGSIQRHSSLENDYLTNGFWAENRSEELPNAGLTVRFLVNMKEVTGKVLTAVNETMDEETRFYKIDSTIQQLIKNYPNENNYEISVRPFFSGNQYFLIAYEVYKDVRLVGAPPSAIGKFGGDTDNWMWPRHTGDFALFRIYADANNEPAGYDEDNVPYKPNYHFPISIKGIEKDDFTMVFGYPGRTSQYLPSYAVKLITEVENPHQIRLRSERLDIMNKYMDNDPAIRIKYALKNARVSNAWKKWIGENRGLKKLDAIQVKEDFEAEFTNWVHSSDTLKKKYENILPDLKKLYKTIAPYQLAADYFYEAIYAVEIMQFANNFRELEEFYIEKSDNEALQQKISSLQNISNSFYKDYYLPIDKESFSILMKLYYENVEKQFMPDEFTGLLTRYDFDYQKLANRIYGKSMFADQEKLNKFLADYRASDYKKILKDPVFDLYMAFRKINAEQVFSNFYRLNDEIDGLNRKYMKAQMEMQQDKLFYPDANFTLRVAYGKVDDYSPRDAVHYRYYTTLSGIIEKDNPNIYDYKVPDKLKELYYTKDYGRYGNDSIMHVCFTASNHTTGGNSGSPVLNAEGHLIGVNFDRNWEGTMSDIMYDPDQCRNIALDIRYALFIIDKFAGAGHLIEEMTIIE